MGQVRKDTGNQRAAKERVAEKLRCPACQRRSALSTRYELMDGYRRIGWERECRYCGHRVGRRNGQSFGR